MKSSRSRVASTISAQTYKDGNISKEYAQQIAALLLYEGRVGQLDSILRDVQADWAAQGYVEVIARSAHPLTYTAKADIEERVRKLYPAANNIVVTEIADSTIIGGVKICLSDQQLDLSVEAKLNTFKQLTGAGKD